MLKNYFTIALRNFRRNKIYSAINIVGLSIGLAVCMLIMLYTAHEYSYDHFHKNADRIFSTSQQTKLKAGDDVMNFSQIDGKLAPEAKQQDPNVESFVRFYQVAHPAAIIENIQNTSLKFSEENFLFADSNFFNFLTFKLLKGNPSSALQSPFSVVISEKAAKKYFGDKDPVGQSLRYNNEYNFSITAVAAKVPSNSNINFDFVASLSSLNIMRAGTGAQSRSIIESVQCKTYFLLADPKQAPKLSKILTELDQPKFPNGKPRDDMVFSSTFFLHPIKDMHLDPNDSYQFDTKYLKIFSLVAVLILLLALINYMSLSTARATLRAKEIGVRKVMGANRKTIAAQFFIESGLYTSMAFVLGYILCVAIQPAFFNFLQIDIDQSFLYSPGMIFLLVGLFLVTLVLAATYPSLVLSAYKPVMVLYGKISKHSGGISVRRFFTVFQFTISIVLIICGLVIERQMYFFMHADTGIDRERIVMVPFASNVGKHYAGFKRETQSLAAISEVSTSKYPMYKGYDIFDITDKNTKRYITLQVLTVDENFVKMLGLKWKIPPVDSLYYQNGEVIINETALEKLNLGKQPLNETINFGPKQRVAGVLKDFNYQSLEDKIGPLCLFTSKERDTASAWEEMGGCLFAKIKPHANTATALDQIATIYKKYEPMRPFEFRFMDEAFESVYKAEDRLAKISIAFVLITLLIASLGLLGLATFMAEQRTKEIGIRKVLGASVGSITVMLSKDFIKLVMIAIVIASPIAWWAMSKWLQGFAYRIDIGWWVFVAAGLLAIIIALATVSFQAIKAATANPVKSLRTE